MLYQHNPKEITSALSGALSSQILNEKLADLGKISTDGVAVVMLDDAELTALELPREFVLAKVVRLPENFLPKQESHPDSVQITGVISGEIIWAQGNETIEKRVLNPGDSIYTPVSTFHAHATGNSPAILLALFTNKNPSRAEKSFNWDE